MTKTSPPRAFARRSAFRTVLPALLAAAACGDEGAPPAPEPTIAQRLRIVAERTDLDNEYLAVTPLHAARRDVGEWATAEPAKRVAVLMNASYHELRVGDEAAAVERMREATDLLGRLKPAEAAANAAAVRLALGIACLRRGEVENCCARHTPDSCVMPIRGDGLHTKTSGSTEAAAAFLQVLAIAKRGSDDWWNARWLLNVAHMTLGTWPSGVPAEHRLPANALGAPAGFPRFPNVVDRAGLGGENLAGGVAAEDFDGDGFVDLVVSSWDCRRALRYYANDGHGLFVERGAEAGLSEQLGGLNILSADYDEDGDPDLYVTRGAWLFDKGRIPNSLLRNDGGVFVDVTREVGLTGVDYPTQTAAWSDYDGDGDLDLYVGSEAQPRVPHLQYPGQLFRNDGGRFVDVAKAAGVENVRMCKGVAWGDFDGDARPDLYVSNLGDPNRLYRNNGDGTFTDVAPKLGVTAPLDGFPCWFFDADNDGILDLYAAAFFRSAAPAAEAYFGKPRPENLGRLYRGDGKGGFVDSTDAWGLNRCAPTMGANFGDLNNDGFPDFYLGTGAPSFDALTPNVMWLNEGGRRFRDVTAAGGFGVLQKGHGIAFVDYDNDGDQDVFAQVGGAYGNDVFQNQLFENPGAPGRWARISLVGRTANRPGFGARIKADVESDGVRRSVYAHVGSVASFGSGPAAAHLGLGRADRILRLEVRWPAPSTSVQVFEDVAVDAAYEVVEGEPAPRPVAYRRVKPRDG